MIEGMTAGALVAEANEAYPATLAGRAMPFAFPNPVF